MLLSNFAKKTISLTLTLIFLVNASYSSFAQFLPDAKPEEKNFFSNDSLAERIKNYIPAEKQVQNICAGLMLCGGNKSAENAIVASYLNKPEFLALLNQLNIEAPINAYETALAREHAIFDNYILQVKKLYTGNIDAANMKLLAEVLPAMMVNSLADQYFKAYVQSAYNKFFDNLNKTYPSPKELTQNGDGIKRYIADIIRAYSIVADPSGIVKVSTFMNSATVTNFAVILVPAYAELLLTTNNYPLLENYIKRCAIAEQGDADSGSMFSITDIVKQTADLKDRYAPGRVTQNAMYVIEGEGDSALLGNIWEELPQIIVDLGGDKGVQLINNIFYNGLNITMTSDRALLPYAYWEKGAIIPFIIGSLNTNKIQGRPVQNQEALRKQHGANLAGLVEISLLNYKFYDLNNPTYKRVRKILTAPYWGQIKAELNRSEFKPSRNNLSVFKNTSFSSIFENDNQFNGTLYNPSYRISDRQVQKVGILLNDSDQLRNNKKAMWKQLTNITTAADITIGVVLAWQMATAVVSIAKSVPQMVANIKNSVRMLKMARAMAGTGKGSWLKTIKALNEPLLKSAMRQSIARGEKTVTLSNTQLQTYKDVFGVEYSGTVKNVPAANTMANSMGAVPGQTIAVTPTNATPKATLGKKPQTFETLETDLMAKGNDVINLAQQKQHTAQIGGGSGGGVYTPPPSTVVPVRSNGPVYDGYHGPSKPYTPRAPIQPVDPARIEKANRAAIMDQIKDVFGQFKRSFKNYTGAMAIVTNLSITNPAVMEAAQAGRIGPMIENMIMNNGAKVAGAGKTFNVPSLPASALQKGQEVFSAVKDVVTHTKPSVIFPYLKTSSNPLTALNPSLFMKTAAASVLLSTSPLTLMASPMPAAQAAIQQQYIPDGNIQDPSNYVLRTAENWQKTAMPIPALRHNAEARFTEVIASATKTRAAILADIQSAFPDKFSIMELAPLHAGLSNDEITTIAPYISKNLFNAMFDLSTTEGDIAKIQAAIAQNSEKNLRNALKGFGQKRALLQKYIQAINEFRVQNQGVYFTIASNAPLTASYEQVKASITPVNDITETVVQNFFKIKPIKEAALKHLSTMNLHQRNAIVARINVLENEMRTLEKQGFTGKNTLKPIIAGNKYEWEQSSKLTPESIILSVEEDGGNIAQIITDWAHKKNIPLPEGNNAAMQMLPAWLAEQIGITKESQGVVTKDATGGFYIYSADGKTRLRMGSHEVSTISNIHLHIETIKDGRLVNKSYYLRETIEDLNLEKMQKAFANADEAAVANTSRILSEIAARFGSKELYEAAGSVNAATTGEDLAKVFGQFSAYATNAFATAPYQQLGQSGLIANMPAKAAPAAKLNIHAEKAEAPAPQENTSKKPKALTLGQFNYYLNNPGFSEEIKSFKRNYPELYNKYTGTKAAPEEYVSVSSMQRLSAIAPYGAMDRFGDNPRIKNSGDIDRQRVIEKVEAERIAPTKAEAKEIKTLATSFVNKVQGKLRNKNFKTVEELQNALMAEKVAFLKDYKDKMPAAAAKTFEYVPEKGYAPAGVFLVRNNAQLKNDMAPFNKQGIKTMVIEVDLSPVYPNGVFNQSALRDAKRILIPVKFENGNITPIRYYYTNDHYYNFYDLGK